VLDCTVMNGSTTQQGPGAAPEAPVPVRSGSLQVAAPALDDDQARVVASPGGPLLVLAGPGTGKTTTLVEAVVDRVERRGLAPEQVLVLTFSRRAAQELRERISARLGRTTRGALAMTFHSYAYALLRRELAASGGPPLSLLSGPEQDLEVGRLLAGDLDDGAVRWPERLRQALPLAGFRAELRDLLLRAQERGVGPTELAALGAARGRDDWVAAAAFLRDYESRFDLDPFREVLDYAGLGRAAAALLETDTALRERERAAHRVVLVDEYQDTDPAQVRLLQALAGQGRDLIAVGDPDQSIYAFRGADVGGILRFRDTFRTVAGHPAPVAQLRTCRRSGPVLLAASRALATRLPAGGLTPGFRDLRPDPAVVTAPGRVEVLLATTTTAEAALVAGVLRRAHLVDGVAWSDMAVLLRSTTRSLAGLRRGLLSAGVPVAVASDEVPLNQEPVVRALLDLLRLALRPAAEATEDAVVALLTGPLVRSDSLAVRRLRRDLRARSLVDPQDDGVPDRPAPGRLLVEEVCGVGTASALLRAHPPLGQAVRLVTAVRDETGMGMAVEAVQGASVEQVLWAAWAASGLAERLERDSRRGGQRGASADRALDAVIGLFDAAARYVDRLPAAGVLGFADDVDGQCVPAESLSQRTPDGDAVRVLSAHASKGLQWRVVVVAGVQEGSWPDLRRHGSLLGADELVEAADEVRRTGPGAAPPAYARPADAQPADAQPADASADVAARRAELLAEERRLFYVAVTRAAERLVVTAVQSGDDGGERPSRLLAELGVTVPELPTPTGRPLTAAALVAELRAVAASSDDPALREAACQRLARMAAGAPGAPKTDAADPDRWWGLAPLSEPAPLTAPGELVRVSPSKVQAFDACALRWLLDSAVGLSSSTGPAQVLGSLVHALCELASGPDAPTSEQLHERLAGVTPRLDLGAPWAARRRGEQALEWLDKFLQWEATNARELVDTEVELRVPLPPHAELVGRVDRLERDEQGRAVVVDLKTGTAARAEEVERHPQLGAYQVACERGAFADRGLLASGGASLLQLKHAKTAKEQVQPPLSADSDPLWADALLARVVEGMGASSFPATVNDGCRTCPVKPCCPRWPQGQSVLR